MIGWPALEELKVDEQESVLPLSSPGQAELGEM